MIELMKNAGVPKTRAPFSSFNSPETEAILDVLHMDDALELMRELMEVSREFRRYLRYDPLALRNARFEKVFGYHTNRYLSQNKI